MRKIVTGEQIAQLTNPDPFAVPTWRAPGLPHPRLDHRPRPAGPVPGLAGPADRPAPGRRRRPGRAGAGLAECRAGSAWSSWPPGRGGPGGVAVGFWPVLVHPVDRGPARGKWRGWWCYRRRWAGVMAVSGLAPWHQGRIYCCRCSARSPPPGTPTGWPSGWCPASRPADFAGSRGQPGARVRRHVVPGPHRTVRGGGAGVRPPRRPGRRSSPPCPSPHIRICGRCRSAGGRTGCRGWSGCMARIC